MKFVVIIINVIQQKHNPLTTIWKLTELTHVAPSLTSMWASITWATLKHVCFESFRFKFKLFSLLFLKASSCKTCGWKQQLIGRVTVSPCVTSVTSSVTCFLCSTGHERRIHQLLLWRQRLRRQRRLLHPHDEKRLEALTPPTTRFSDQHHQQTLDSISTYELYRSRTPGGDHEDYIFIYSWYKRGVKPHWWKQS